MPLPVIPRKIKLASFYNRVMAPRGFQLAPHHYPVIAGIEDTRIENLLVLCPPGAGKSALLSTILPCWELGHDPSLTVMSVSAGEALPQSFMRAAMDIIANNPVFRSVFPDARPSPEKGWSLQRGLHLSGHHDSDQDASFNCYGLASKRLTGAHARYHIYDDIHDRENVASPEQRADVRRVYYDTLLGRADPRGVRRIAVGRWWAEDDVYQDWIESGDWVVLELPATRPDNARLWYDVMVPKGMTCVFTESTEPEPVQDPDSSYIRYRVYYGAVDPKRRGFYWPGSPSKRKEYEQVKRRMPRVAAINYDGDMTGGQDAIFREDDFLPYLSPADLRLGRAAPGLESWIQSCRGEVEQAWDTALGQPQSVSRTVALTGLLVPCKSWHRGEDVNAIGEAEFHFDVWLLWAHVADLDFRELALALRAQYSLWMPRRVIVEEKTSGVPLIQSFRGSHIPIYGQKVDQGKIERAISPVLRDEHGHPIGGGGASVQGWARMGRIRYPADAPWILTGPDGDPLTGFLRQVLQYRGGLQVSDEFDALVHLVTRAIVKSRRHGKAGIAESLPPDHYSVGAQTSLDDPRRQLLNAFGDIPIQHEAMVQAFHPWSGMCGAPCLHFGVDENHEYCHLHGRRTSSVGGCASWAMDQRRAAA